MKNPSFSHADLLNLLFYNSETGHFFCRSPRHKTKIGEIADRADSYGRRTVFVFGKRYFAHRLAWFYVHGSFPDGCIDHINNNHADNRIQNLRVGTHAENMQNHTRARSDSKSNLIGVSLHQGKWRADIVYQRKKTYLGAFDTKEDAHQAYLNAKRLMHPFCTI